MKGFLLSVRTKMLFVAMAHFMWMMTFGGHSVFANTVALYTPYPEITVPPGESIDYSVDVINNSGSIKNVGVSLSGVPDGWEHSLKSGGWTIGKVAVMPGEKKTLSLKVDVPHQVEKGVYKFQVVAQGLTSLPLVVTVSETGTFKSEFTSTQPNVEGHSNATFSYNAKLRNMTSEPQFYALRSDAPRGWNVSFRANGKQVSSVNVEANQTLDVAVEVSPPKKIKAGNYKIPIQAVTRSTSADLELEAAVKGNYEIELTTPTGLLSTNVTAGGKKRLELLVKNNGSSTVNDIKLDKRAPVDWDVVFEPNEIKSLEPGENAKVYATIQASKKAIAGDYMATLEANNPDVSEKAAFRVSVKTPVVWGWLGIMLILGVFGGVFQLFKKYGRR
ncbi:COG1470 family protein [Pleomorphovibrio marinus]|uniref:COG1470 family protein n=1 Tax=Pleomorphovibrio marinus TaxID=2164132 RepID=UPI001E28B440|nr:NEW3 domain-containing protein [Pleomorphovibrio marinus]